MGEPAATLREVLAHHARRRPEAVFLIAPEPKLQLGYREFQDKSRLVAR